MNIRIHIYDIPSENKLIADYLIEQGEQSHRSSWASDVEVVDEESRNRFINSISKIIQEQLVKLK